MAKKQTNKKRATFSGFAPIIIPPLIGLLITAVIAAAMVIAIGKIAYNGNDPSAYSRLIGLTALYTAVFAGGLSVSVIAKKDITCAILHALLCTAVLLVCGLAAGSISAGSPTFKVLVPVCSMLGYAVSLLKVPKKRKPKFKSRSK